MSKHSSLVMILLVLVFLVTACAPAAAPVPASPTAVAPASTEVPAASPTEAAPAPTQPAEQPATPAADASGPVFVLFDKQAGMLRSYNLDGSLRFESPAPELTYVSAVTMSIHKDAIYYASSDGADKTLYRASAQGAQNLGINIGKLTAFKVSPDEQWIAWSTLNVENDLFVSSLFIKNLQSTAKDAQEIAKFTLPMGKPVSLVPIKWAEDNSGILYFERSKVGYGGYLLYNGNFSLHSYDMASGQFTTHVAAEEDRGLCLDTFRLDLNKVAYRCGKDSIQISVRDLATGAETAVPLLPEQGTAGTAEFSPSGQWLAYATARSNPDDEAGQVAVVPSDLSAQPQVIFKVSQKRYPEVQGWLDEDTLLITIANPSEPRHTVMTIRRDGTDAREIAAGEFAGWVK